MNPAPFLIAVFLASLVESIEALTIVVAVGVTRGWRIALSGAALALLVLALIVGIGGTALIRLVPLNALRIGIGMLLLYMGVKWLRKAILRSAGLKAIHDEDRIYASTIDDLHLSKRRGLLVAFNGVFLEGTEVVMIVFGLGATQHHLASASLAALSAVLGVAIVGAALVKPLSSVNENALKTVVGVMMVSFGTFWLGEGAGLHWPVADASLLGLVGLVSAFVFGAIAFKKHSLQAVS